MSFVPDITTAKGRKEIAYLAYKVAQTKTYLDGLGKDLVA
ncbi:cell envelope biogenesis protein TolA, partial [Escherichia coli]|nr:cell envelope biogenesis protein TolA [Escherichia coli]